MNALKRIKPYSDTKLTYNNKTNEYELSFEFCKEEYPQNFIDDDTLKFRIKKNTRVVYSFIRSRVNQYNRPFVDVLLSRTEQGREFIFELLRTQFESDIDSTYNDIGDTPAINFSNGQVLPREEIRRNLTSVNTETIWDNNASYFGFNIGYQAVFPPYVQIMIRGYR